MVIQFSIGNYRSFNSVQTINFRATGLVSEDKTVDANNIAEVAGQRLLKTIGVYGPNASGKSNLVKGFRFFNNMVASSLENEDFLSLFLNPNKQAIINESDDWGYFQIVLLLHGKKYRYGFTLSEDEVATEWLFGPAEKNETYYFIRKGENIDINGSSFSEGLNIPYDTKLRIDALFLSFCSSYNGEISSKIRDFIANKIKIEGGPKNYYLETNSMVKDGKKEVVLKWLNEAGLLFNDIIIKDFRKTYYPREGQAPNEITSEGLVKVYKNIYNKKGEIINSVIMNLNEDESDGTQKYYSFIGKLYDKFENGGLFISDEIDSNFHPSLLQKIIGLFNNPFVNKANAQLLFTSHDTNLMSPEIMRRDQFYFTEKSATDETILYSLSDLKGIRNNADFARQYLAGYYGALPVLGNFLEETQSIENPEK